MYKEFIQETGRQNHGWKHGGLLGPEGSRRLTRLVAKMSAFSQKSEGRLPLTSSLSPIDVALNQSSWKKKKNVIKGTLSVFYGSPFDLSLKWFFDLLGDLLSLWIWWLIYSQDRFGIPFRKQNFPKRQSEVCRCKTSRRVPPQGRFCSRFPPVQGKFSILNIWKMGFF